MNQLKIQNCEEGFNIKRFIIVVSAILLLCYGIFNARKIIIGPSIEIIFPLSENTETSTSTLKIKGLVQNSTFISINERPIHIDKEGIFEEKLLLMEGSNIIIIRAKDRFGGEKEKKLNIYYKQ